ncbi:MAG: Octanoyltransferase LipM [Calditrichaeota bacterium]|nr:Octanoyltransferase LipM [Calditrichota bacterium]
MDDERSAIWTVGPDGCGDRQMELDRHMAAAARASGATFIRLYHFAPPCVSLGCFQRADEIDRERCRDAGIDVTRRPTGGRAVLHKGDLVYAIAVPLPADERERSKGRVHLGVYNRVSAALQEAFLRLGLDAGAPAMAAAKQSPSSSIARLCFGSTTRHEVQIRGRKVVGSAQRRFRDVVLQHGSILVTDENQQLVDLLPGLDDAERRRLRESIRRRTTSLTAAGFAGDEREPAGALADAFARQFGPLRRVRPDQFVRRLSSAAQQQPGR